MAENQTDPRKNFVPRFMPWLLAAGAFVVYWFTLNRWVSLLNLNYVAKTSGWLWQPEVINPISFLLTYPLRRLPAAEIPIALNIFTAACAALTLGLLARSVAILPQDRTEAQRKRERSDFSFLTTSSAWLPPFLAVAVCGLQLTFWEQATNCTGNIFDLLLFAFIVWSLLEYRLNEREWRLFLAALVYGAGMSEDWALVGFLPVFIAAIIWVRGFNFFNVRFLTRMALCGLAGMLFYFFLPLAAVVSGKMPVTFWQALKLNLSGQFDTLKLFFVNGDVRYALELLSLTSLLPVLVLAIRWKSSFGDSSQIGVRLANLMFHLIHGIFLVLCIWVAFDPPFSPRHLGLGFLFLTFYYLGALSVGYFSGYFLLVFGKEIGGTRSQRKSPLRFVKLPVIGGVWLLSILTVAGLIYKNVPQIHATNDNTFQRYASFMVENLPRSGGFLLCDSDDPSRDNPIRLFLARAELERDGRAKDFVPLDTWSLQFPAYQRFLHKQFPDKWPELVSAEQTRTLNPLGLIGVLAKLAQTNELYYLHPSFGYYFEQFYLEPHGLVYKMKTLPNDTLLPPHPDKNQIAENEAFWSRAEKTAFAPVVQALKPPDPNAPQTFVENLFARLHIAPEPNQNALIAGTFYSRGLDFWGVQLQRSGELEKAAAQFSTATNLNPDNVVAQINLQFNQNLRAGRRLSVDLSTVTADQFGKYRTWNEVLLANGPFDEPSFCFEDGIVLARDNEYLRQAVAPFERVRELVPDNLPARFWLGQLYEISHLPDRALDALRDPMEQPEKFSLDENNSTQLNILAATAYFQKNDVERGTRLIELEISRHPTNDDMLTTAAQIYLARGLPANALAVIDRKLRLSPDDVSWLYNKGCVSIQLQKYDDAIAALSRVIAVQTNNYDALFKRAGAYLQLGKLDEARADYTDLQQSFTNSPQAAYGLAEIAWRRHETNDAIVNYEIYIANAPTNTTEAKTVSQRLRELKK
jgi:tetratricopeptide (TPR) repeat protein